MRVIAGSARGRRLRCPAGREVRPTADRVRESLFAILGGSVEGARVLDLFAGAGTLGIEALSRGAAEAVFVEGDRRVAAALRSNLEATGFLAQSRIIVSDVFAALRRLAGEGGKFQLILADPPYGRGLARRTVEALASWAGKSAGCRLVVEHSRHDDLPPWVEGLSLVRQERYGETVLSFYQVASLHPTERQEREGPEKEKEVFRNEDRRLPGEL
ncbi:MAG: 16S rRNA (guanine(966)-N(2))-methyltransferase RsmD [Bacillota bacterium]|nr:16S rRNA (guanine(966)-N(2))-methyltransferase RsmD [Bacillota bacterium]